MTKYRHYSEFPAADWRWPNFSPREMASKREGELLIDPAAMDRLQALRSKLGRPLIVTSAYRSPAHNRAVGGAPASQHLLGRAFDVMMTNHDPAEFIAAAQAAGFTGIGTYPKNNFVHIDTGPARRWGEPFPATANRLPQEPPRQPETIREDAEAQAVVGVGASGAVAVAIDALPAAGGLLGGLAPAAQVLAILLAAGLLTFILWRRVR